MDDVQAPEARVLMLLAPGAQSERFAADAGEFALEIRDSTTGAVSVIGAVGTPGPHLPYEYDVLAWIEPVGDEVRVTLSPNEESGDGPRLAVTLPSQTRADRLAVARQVGQYADEFLRLRRN